MASRQRAEAPTAGQEDGPSDLGFRTQLYAARIMQLDTRIDRCNLLELSVSLRVVDGCHTYIATGGEITASVLSSK